MTGRMSAREAIEHLPPQMRERLATEIPAGTLLLRALRFVPAADFDDVTADELDNAIRWLYAAAYSATEGARRLGALARAKRTEESDPCKSDPRTTAANTNTDAPPPADPPSAPNSESNSPTTETSGSGSSRRSAKRSTTATSTDP